MTKSGRLVLETVTLFGFKPVWTGLEFQLEFLTFSSLWWFWWSNSVCKVLISIGVRPHHISSLADSFCGLSAPSKCLADLGKKLVHLHQFGTNHTEFRSKLSKNENFCAFWRSNTAQNETKSMREHAINILSETVTFPALPDARKCHLQIRAKTACSC